MIHRKFNFAKSLIGNLNGMPADSSITRLDEMIAEYEEVRGIKPDTFTLSPEFFEDCFTLLMCRFLENVRDDQAFALGEDSFVYDGVTFKKQGS